jgi:hypothetical protein
MIAFAVVFDIVPILPHPPVDERRMRRGGEEENAVFAASGPFDALMSNETVAGGMPVTFLKPFDIPTYKFVTPHASLRAYKEPFDVTEIDPQYEIRPNRVKFADIFDGKELVNANPKLVWKSFLHNTPGYDGPKAIDALALEKRLYYQKRLAKLPDFAYFDNIEEACPEMLTKKELDDDFSDSDSEDEFQITLKVAMRQRRKY